MERSNARVCLVNSPINSVTESVVLDNHIRTLMPTCDEILVIAGDFSFRYGDQVHIVEIEGPGSGSTRPHVFRRMIHNLTSQFFLTWHVLTMRNDFDLAFLDVGEYRNPLPMLVAKLLGKKTVVFHRGGNKFLEARLDCTSGWEKLVPFVQECLMRVSYLLVDHILCEAKSIVRFGKLERYERKILVFGPTYIDTDRFRVTTTPGQRENLVGHLGRLVPKKRTVNLVRAIAGQGPELERVEREIEALGVKEQVTLVPFIPHDELPEHLNRLKLIVLPSEDEGVPTTMMEAMACGVVVLARPVGGIPDVIFHDETGFILEDNTPQCIARGILRALAHPELGRISQQAREFIQRERSFQAGVAGWKDLLAKLSAGARRDSG